VSGDYTSSVPALGLGYSEGLVFVFSSVVLNVCTITFLKLSRVPECMMPFFTVLYILNSLSAHVLSCNTKSEVILLLQLLKQLLPSQPTEKDIKKIPVVRGLCLLIYLESLL